MSMIDEGLSQALILLAAAVVVVAAARRLGLPSLLGYLAVGTVLGPYAFAVISESSTSRLLPQLGVVFLLFTLGLEFSWPRMLAMRREVFGIGSAQVLGTAAVVSSIAVSLGQPLLISVVFGGAVAMSSTVIIVQQLTEQAELNRTHGRIAFSVVLFQDLAIVPFLALASAVSVGSGNFTAAGIARAVGGGVLAVGLVLLAGRFVLRPLLNEIAHSRLRELFTLAVLLTALGSAWASHLAGLSLGAGGFLAGMMLAESEYRHQVEVVIKPFRDILLGLFFISVGMLLDLSVLARDFWLILALLAGLIVVKLVVATSVVRAFGVPSFKALRAGVALSVGGEFGIALVTLLLQGHAASVEVTQSLLVAIVLSMVLSPFILRNNKRFARLVLGERGPPAVTALMREEEVAAAVAKREHVILCGYGRVGQNIARVLESQGYEYIALDLDPARIRVARQGGDPVLYGDSADEELLRKCGVENASAVIITFANPAVSLGIVRAVRLLRRDVPILVRTQDDVGIKELQDAGATEVVPETFEASLMLVSHALMLLNAPVSRVVRTIGEIRSERYATLRNIYRHDNALPLGDEHQYREELKSVVVPPGAWSVGRSLREVRERGADVIFTAIRRQGILGREPSIDTQLRDGDIVVLYGLPVALEHAEAVLLAG